VLAEFLLTESADQAKPMLAELLAEDPVLLIWTVCVAHQRGGLQPKTVGEAADWLARHVINVLVWPADEPEIQVSENREIWADRVAKAFQVAETAALLATDSDTECADRAWFQGLLCHASEWLADCCHAPLEQPTAFLPNWLAKATASTDPAAAAVNRAIELLAGQSTLGPHPIPEKAGTYNIDLAASHQRAEAIRSRWLASADRWGSYLPRLTALLSRLAILENEFWETLEREKLQSMAEFAAGAGHEINNPLTVIAGRAQLFLHEETDPERRRALALMNSQAMRIYEMIADMMLFARPPQPNFVPVDLAKIIDELMANLQTAAAAQETVLTRSGLPGPLEIEADAVQISVAVQALCQNSLEALGHGGQIEIELQARHDEAAIRVTDNGPGITPEQRRHIFDPFYSARQAGRGLGLGLSKCWRIVTNHGGHIEVSSQGGQGATFVITLPRQQTSGA
jgi:signal transduction histidine kinase